jgi:hypothetical protein
MNQRNRGAQQGRGADTSCVYAGIRGELARLGLAKTDLDRRGIFMADLDREARRLLAERGGPIVGVLAELLGICPTRV